MYTCTGAGDFGCLPPSLSNLCMKQGPLLEQRVLVELVSSMNPPPHTHTHRHPPSTAAYTGTMILRPLSILHGCWESGPHGYTASTLPTKSSLLPPFLSSDKLDDSGSSNHAFGEFIIQEGKSGTHECCTRSLGHTFYCKWRFW